MKGMKLMWVVFLLLSQAAWAVEGVMITVDERGLMQSVKDTGSSRFLYTQVRRTCEDAMIVKEEVRSFKLGDQVCLHSDARFDWARVREFLAYENQTFGQPKTLRVPVSISQAQPSGRLTSTQRQLELVQSELAAAKARRDAMVAQLSTIEALIKAEDKLAQRKQRVLELSKRPVVVVSSPAASETGKSSTDNYSSQSQPTFTADFVQYITFGSVVIILLTAAIIVIKHRQSCRSRPLQVTISLEERVQLVMRKRQVGQVRISKGFLNDNVTVKVGTYQAWCHASEILKQEFAQTPDVAIQPYSSIGNGNSYGIEIKRKLHATA